MLNDEQQFSNTTVPFMLESRNEEEQLLYKYFPALDLINCTNAFRHCNLTNNYNLYSPRMDTI